jgi:pilus assembly protein CpaE
VIGAGAGDQASAGSEAKKSLLGGFDFKALLTKKAKPEPATADK